MSVQSVHYVRISLESPNLYEKLEKKLHIQHFGKVWTFLSQFNRELIRVTRWTSICATLITDITIIYRYFFHFMSNNFETFETMSGYVWRERVIGSLKVKHVKYFWWLPLLWIEESTVNSFNSNHISTHSRLLLPMPPTSHTHYFKWWFTRLCQCWIWPSVRLKICISSIWIWRLYHCKTWRQ